MQSESEDNMSAIFHPHTLRTAGQTNLPLDVRDIRNLDHNASLVTQYLLYHQTVRGGCKEMPVQISTIYRYDIMLL